MYKIWDRKFGYYCLSVYTREQAEEMIKHFEEMDFVYAENRKDRYRIDLIND